MISLKIPGLPKRTNNSRSHWRAKHAEAKKWKTLVANHARIYADIPKKPWANAHLTLTRHSSVRPDYDGLVSSFKHVIDGLIEAGIIANDKHENIGISTYLWEKCPPRDGHITIVVEPTLEEKK
jgi:hypothetical protein